MIFNMQDGELDKKKGASIDIFKDKAGVVSVSTMDRYRINSYSFLRLNSWIIILSKTNHIDSRVCGY